MQSTQLLSGAWGTTSMLVYRGGDGLDHVREKPGSDVGIRGLVKEIARETKYGHTKNLNRKVAKEGPWMWVMTVTEDMLREQSQVKIRGLKP